MPENILPKVRLKMFRGDQFNEHWYNSGVIHGVVIMREAEVVEWFVRDWSARYYY